ARRPGPPRPRRARGPRPRPSGRTPSRAAAPAPARGAGPRRSTATRASGAYANAVISVVVPVHDEERSVALLHEELAAALDPLGQPWEVVFVDDGSTDGTFAAL